MLTGPSLTETAGFGVLDPDGLPDLVTTDGIPDAYTQYIRRYHAYSYASPMQLSPGNEPRSPRILDLNGDGVPDLVVDNTLDHTLAVYFGDPATRQLGTTPFILSDPNLLTTDHGEHTASDPLVVGDLDNDGVQDVVFAVARIVWIHRPAASPDAYQIGYASNLLVGDSYINLTNTGTVNGADPAGRICVNLYAFDPAEEMVSCCSCLVTPNGLNALSVKQDLLGNTLTPGIVGSAVIALLATSPMGGSCDAASPTIGTLVSGIRAWGTTLHQSPVTGLFATTESAFQGSVASESEITKLTSYCGFMQASGSGYGICKSCQVGGLGAGHQ